MGEHKLSHYFLFTIAILLIVIALLPITRAVISELLVKMKLPGAATYINS